MICPVCLENECNINTPCNHPICNQCIERILCIKFPAINRFGSSAKLLQEQVEDEIISCTPNYGRCPTCRRMINLFELEKLENEDASTKGNGSIAADIFYKKEPGIGPLEGKIFALDEKLNVGSIHFVKGRRTKKEKDKVNENAFSFVKPYVSYENEEIKKITENVDDAFQPQSRFYFSPGYHFHKKSNTFYGTIEIDHLSSSWYGSNKWEYIIQFSSNLLYATGGCIILHGDTATQNVKMDSSHIAKLDYKSEVGVLTNVTTSSPKVLPFGLLGRSLRQYYSIPRTVVRPIYERNRLWGNTFIQGGIIGLASYHFLGPDVENGIYISYESNHTAFWGTLDDGSPLPSRVPFHNVQFDQNTSTFRGVIDWKEDYGTSWHGSEKWVYKMVFDKEFTKIKEGEVRNYIAGGGEGNCHEYGVDLNYYNAAL